MCGLVAFIALKDQSIPEPLLVRAGNAIAHRGPDDARQFIWRNVGLAFRRLSIIDVAGGMQPLFNEDRSIALVCNGEIYNAMELRKDLESVGHRFATNSDCEALLHCYEQRGDGFLQVADGMFAGIILDMRQGRLIAFRDKFGIKPLHFFRNNEWLLIASELKGLLASTLTPRELDPLGVQDAMTYGFIPGKRTSFRELQSFEPAHFTTVDLSTRDIRTDRYWIPPLAKRTGFGALTQLGKYANKLRAELERAVRTHAISDVPVGTYLSGGIDSTVVAMLLKRAEPDSSVKSFSIAFDETEFDESSIFDRTAAELKLDRQVQRCHPNDASLFRKAIYHIEQPQKSPMDVPLMMLSKLARDNGTKVVLCGEGSDEVLGGYPCFLLAQIRRGMLLKGFAPARESLLRGALKVLQINSSMEGSFRETFGTEVLAAEKRWGYFPPWLPYWLSGQRDLSEILTVYESKRIFEHEYFSRIGEWLRKDYQNIAPFEAGIFVEIKTRLPNYILHRTDRNSMANGVEARVPFLDSRAAEASLSVPSMFKLWGMKEKFVLRKAFGKDLPAAVAARKKFGYSAPNQWLWNDKPAAWILDLMNSEALRSSGVFKAERVQELMRRFDGYSGTWTAQHHRDAAMLTGILSVQVLHHDVRMVS